MKALTFSFARKAVVATVIAILVLTVLEVPPPIGFETRPQSDVSSFWLVFFLIILIVEIATIPMVYKRQRFESLEILFTSAFPSSARVKYTFACKSVRPKFISI